MKIKLKGAFYWISVFFLVTATVSLYIAWDRHYVYTHPGIIKAQPYFYAEELPVQIWLLWDEYLVNSSSEGTVHYRYPDRIMRVPKGAVLAEINQGGRVRERIRSAKEGYFIPATDGKEGVWTYPFLWNSQGNISDPHLTWYSDIGDVRKGQTLGKLVYQPQELKGVVFADLTPELEKDIKTGWVKIRHDPLSLPEEVRVRVFRPLGSHKVQMYLDLPFFPLDIIASRQVSYTLYTGEQSGVVIPESSLVLRKGIKGVFQVKGNFSEFTKVDGLPLGKGKFFVSSGLKPGNLVVQDGSRSREGRIKLW